MKSPRVSVILTFYNRPDMVRRAIGHILAQSFRDFELILVDDCSDAVLSLNDIDFNTIPVRHLRNDKNLGANRARLRGLMCAIGEYICFHDDDDYWMGDKLKKQVQFLDDNLDVSVVTSFALANKKIIEFPISPSRLILSIYNCVGSFSIPMIRNSPELGNALDNDLSNAQDWHVWRSLEKTGTIATIPSVLVFFDDGAHDRISSVKNVERYYSSYLRVALLDNPEILIRAFHQFLARYHCSQMVVSKVLFGVFYGMLRGYIKARLSIGKF